MTNQSPARLPKSETTEAICLLSPFLVVLAVGAFVNAFAAFVLLPVAIGIWVVLFFDGRLRRALPARWPAVLTGNGLILAFLLSLLFLGFETYYRFGCDQTDAMTNTLVSTAWYTRHFHTNSSGLRDNVDYASAMTPGRPRVTFVGDSCTAGFGVKDVADRFINRIRSRHPDWEVHALAKPGLDTSTELEIVERFTVNQGYQLDQVVLVYDLNDIGELMHEWLKGYRKIMGDRFRKSWLCRNSYFVNLFYHRWQIQRNSYAQNYFDELEAAYKGQLWETEKNALRAFASTIRDRGGRLLVVTLPFMDVPSRFTFAHGQLARFWEEQGVPHLDLLGAYSNVPPAKLVVNPHDAHPNEYAHALAAEAIDAFLKREMPGRVEGGRATP